MNLAKIGATLFVCALVVSGCAGSEEPAGPSGGSQLQPTFRPEKPRNQKSPKKSPGRHTTPSEGAPGHGPTEEPGGGGRGESSAPEPESEPGPGPTSSGSGPRAARTSDRSGDVSGGLGSVPAYVDVTGAELATGYLVTVTAAAPLPRRMTGDDTMNVVAFFDTDGDGSIDYEALANLADTGWTTSSRGPSGSRFGSESGVQVTVSGNTMTLRFAPSLLGGARKFRWAVGAEYGTYEQVASGTTAHDYAPDSGAVAFPR